jgi:hypothetical protein
MSNTKITAENLPSINTQGLVLVFATRGKIEQMGKVHAPECSVAKKALNNPRAHTMMDNLASDITDLLDRGFGVTLCKCAQHAKK